jgi:hypothetical protein
MPQAWFRFYSETLHDRKVERICRATGECRAVVVGAWAIVLALANDSPVRGALLLTEDVPLTDTDLFDEMGLPHDTTMRLWQIFQDLAMIHQDNGVWYVTHFGNRQYDSDNSTERVQRFRERQKSVSSGDDSAVTETPTQRFSNAPEAEAEQTQIRTDTEAEPESEPTKSQNLPAADTPLRVLLALPDMDEDVARSLLEQHESAYCVAWAQYAASQERLDNPAGYCVKGIKSGRQPPAPRPKKPSGNGRRRSVDGKYGAYVMTGTDADRRRFIEGEYADIIEH